MVRLNKKAVLYMQELRNNQPEEPVRREPKAKTKVAKPAGVIKSRPPRGQQPKVISPKRVRGDSPEVAKVKQVIKLHRDTLKKLVSDPAAQRGEPRILETIATVQQTIVQLLVQIGRGGNKYRRIRDNSLKKKVDRSGPVMTLSPKHHSRKVYISKEQRALNKAKDGVATPTKDIKFKALKSVAGTEHVVVRPKRKLYGYTKNPTPSSRKERHAMAKDLKKLFKKQKYSVYTRPLEQVSKQAA